MTTMFDHTGFTPVAASPNGTADTSGTDALTLRAFAPGGIRAGCPATTGTGDGVVVLGYNQDDAQRVDVYTHHGRRSLPADTPAAMITDPAVRAALLQDALLHLADQLRDARTELTCVIGRHARTLADIRRYAIDQHLEGTYCQEGLNAFLQAFDLPVYEPRVRLSYTITGSYEVDGDDVYDAERDARSYLKVDLSEIDDVVDGSSSFTVEVTETEALDT